MSESPLRHSDTLLTARAPLSPAPAAAGTGEQHAPRLRLAGSPSESPLRVVARLPDMNEPIKHRAPRARLVARVVLCSALITGVALVANLLGVKKPVRQPRQRGAAATDNTLGASMMHLPVPTWKVSRTEATDVPSHAAPGPSNVVPARETTPNSVPTVQGDTRYDPPADLGASLPARDAFPPRWADRRAALPEPPPGEARLDGVIIKQEPQHYGAENP